MLSNHESSTTWKGSLVCAVKEVDHLFFVCLVIFAFTPTYSLGHGGGLDLLGCHHDRRRDDYHCHQGQLAGQSFGSREEALAALGGSSPSTSRTPDRPSVQPPRVDPLGNEVVPIQSRPLRRLERC